MPSFLGAKEMGLKTEWRFGFVGNGQRAETTPGVLYIGAGGAVMAGVIDRRCNKGEGDSLAGIVLRRRELVYNHLLSDWIRRCEEAKPAAGTKWTPVLIMNTDPEFDALVASLLAMRLVEKGEFPVYAEALANYARNVELGRYRIDLSSPETVNSLHLAFMAVRNLKGADGRLLPLETQVSRGIELLDRILSHIQMARSEAKAGPIRRAEDFVIGSPGTTAWLKDPWFADIKKLLDAEPARFQKDYDRATKMEQVPVPSGDGLEPLQVRGFIATIPMESVFAKEWVRGSGYPYFICPSGNPRSTPDNTEGANAIYPRVALSIDPNFCVDGRRLNLRGLGSSLEKLEIECRKARNRGVDDRGGTFQAPDGASENDDPWYDGRNHEWTSVDSPRAGTWVPYSKIIELATKEPYWEIPVRHASLALLWIDKRTNPSMEKGSPLAPVEGMTTALEIFYRESSEGKPALDSGNGALPEGISVSSVTRFFPEKTCPPMRIVRISADSHARLESLAAARARIIEQSGGTSPCLSLVKVALRTGCSDTTRVEGVLAELGGEGLHPLRESGTAGVNVLFNNRAVIIRQDAGQKVETNPDLELEMLIYIAFLKESLTTLSERIGNLLSQAEQPLNLAEAHSLRRDFLRFKARYYRLDPFCTQRGVVVFNPLVSQLRLAERFEEGQSQLDQLAQLEGRLTGHRRPAAEKAMQLVLYFVAAVVTLQTALTLISWLRR